MKIGANKGKKPGAEKAPEKKAPEKKVKRKSRGGGNALAAAKKFFIEHIEKLMLGLMALVAAMLIFRGFSNESMKDSPDTVSTAISRADNVVNAPTWAEEKKKRYAESDNFDEQANQDVISVDVASYDMSRPMYLPMQERRRRRIDPELLAPVELEVKPGYGAVAVRSPAESAGIATALDRNSPDTRPIPDVMMQANRRSTWSSGAGKYEGRFFITITGLVPYKAQFAKFEEAFKDADAYNPERDLPNYGGLQIERAEVVNGQTGEWKALDTETAMFKEPAKWEARVDEMADRTHVLPGANLTMAIPPLYRRSVEQWATHSKVPLDTTGEGSGGGMRTEMRGGENRGEGAGRREGEEALMEEGASGGFFSGGGGGGGESRGELRKPEGAAEGAENTMETAKPRIEGEFALLRYFDFTVELGKTYVYRVRVMLEDPNNPFEGVRPPNSALETEAVVRRNQATEKFRLSSWSTPSAPVSVQAGTQVLAGEVAQPRTISLRDGRVRIESKPADEPIAQVVAMTWKADGPYDVPIPTPVRRGSVLNGNKADAEGVDPTVNKIRKATHNYVTNTLIADIYGGVPLDAKGLTSPGYLLVMSPEGQLEVRSEVQDVASVAENVIPPDDEEKSGMMEGEEGRREGGAEVRTEGGRETGGNGRRPRSGGNRSRNRPGGGREGGGREGGGREEGGREGGGPEAR